MRSPPIPWAILSTDYRSRLMAYETLLVAVQDGVATVT
jgi:hypothetical protein